MELFVGVRRRLARWLAGACLAGLSGLAAAQSLSHAPDQMFHDGLEGVSVGPFTDADASRFLAQATFGPTDADITHLRAPATGGYLGWLNEQFAATPTHQMDYFEWVGGDPGVPGDTGLGEQTGQDTRQEAWFRGALGGHDPQFPANSAYDHKDQLRQRVAFALSEILVISDQNTELGLNGARGMAYYYDILVDNAFGNYRTLLEKVTLSPAMGVYLNMIGNRRADVANNVHPDENYGREINQLFSIGLVMVKPDGTPTTNPPTPTYTQSTITNFAHVLTGWNWASCDLDGYDNFVGCYTYWSQPDDYVKPMLAYDKDYPIAGFPSYHDNGTDPVNDLATKQLLTYPGVAANGIVPNGQTAYQDLTFALDNIYNHPNVGPFISKQLIQRLVTSNPSPAYVQRVSSVFDANRTGSGSSTQLWQVVKAILLDPEARYGQFHNPDTFGKLREPLLALTHLWRAEGAQHWCGQNSPAPVGGFSSNYANPYRYAGDTTAWSTADTQYSQGIAQASQDAFTVFNFFKPSFLPPGEMSTRNLLGPEFQLQTDSIIANSSNAFLDFYIPYDRSDFCDPTSDTIGNVKIDHTPDLALAGSPAGGPADLLVDAYNRRFMSGQMSPFMRQTLLDYLNTIDSSWGSDWQKQRVDRALYLILTSPEYMIQK